jgi:hypothetical protein
MCTVYIMALVRYYGIPVLLNFNIMNMKNSEQVTR